MQKKRKTINKIILVLFSIVILSTNSVFARGEESAIPHMLNLIRTTNTDLVVNDNIIQLTETGSQVHFQENLYNKIKFKTKLLNRQEGYKYSVYIHCGRKHVASILDIKDDEEVWIWFPYNKQEISILFTCGMEYYDNGLPKGTPGVTNGAILQIIDPQFYEIEDIKPMEEMASIQKYCKTILKYGK